MAEFLLNFLGFPILAFVCGVGFLLLSLCYLKRNSCFPVFWKQRNVNQHQGRAKRRRKGGTSKGSRACQSEAEEERKVLSLLQSPLGRHDDTTRFRQLLCPDPFCEVCNNATAEVNWLLYPEALEDATSSASPLVSTSPVTESSFTLSPAFSVVPLGDLAPASLSEPSPLPHSSLSPNPMTPLVDFFSPSPLGHSLAPESFPSLDSEFPVDYSSPQPLAFPPLLTHDTQTADPVVPAEGTMPLNTIFSLDPTFSQDINSLPVLSQAVNPPDSFACHHAPPTLPVSPQPDCTLTVTQSKSFAILLKPVLEKSPPDSPAGLSACVPTIRGTDHSSLSTSDFSWWQAHANTVFLPTLSHSDFQREPVSFHIPETCLWGDSITKHMEAMSHSFLGLNIQELLERQIKKKMAFQHLEKKEKEEASFSKQMWSEYQQTSSENSLQSLDTQDSTALQAGWNTESKSEQLHICQQLPYVKTLGENLPQKYHQLFWGLPSLHSESLVATLLVSSRGFPLEPHFILFNGIYNTSAVKMQDQESSPLLHSHPRPLPSVHPQPLPQTMPQSQPLIFSQVWPQVHLQSRLPILPSSPSQVGDCGVSFHRFQNESDFHIATENQYLERHVLQKQKGSFCGLVPVLQKSQEATCPQAPNLPLVSRSPHTYVPVSILPGHFHIIPGEPQEKLELHVPRRLIPRWYLQACRNLESTTLTVPQCKLTEVPQQKSTHVHLQLSELQGQSRNDVGKSQLGLPGSFHERVPTQFQLRNDMRKNLGYILEKGPEDSPQRVSGCYLVHNLRAALETKSNCVCHSRNHLGNELLNVSRKDTDWNQTKTILRLHVSTKSWQITAGRIPIGVCRSWLADDSTWPLSGSSQTNMEDTNSKNTMVGKVYSQISTLELSFLDPNTLKVLEAHILRFRVSQRWGLPLKVLESIKFYILRETKTWPLPQFDFPSSTIHISGVDSKGEVSKLLEGSSKTSQGSKVRTTNSVTMLDRPLPVISSVGNEGQGTLQPSHSDIDQKLAGNIQTIERGRQTFQLLTHRDKDKVSQRETVRDNRCTSEVPIRQAGGRHEPRDENVNSSDRVEMIQGQKMWEKNLEHSFMSNMPSETFKAKKLCALKSRSCDILTTSKLESSQMTNVNTNKVETTLTTQFPSPKMFVPQDSKVSDLHKQLFSELKFKLESEKHSLAQHCPTDMPLTSDSLPSKSSLTHAQGISSGDTAASQVLHVHLEDSGISTEQWRDPSKHVLWKCPDKRVRPLGSKAGEYRSEDSGKGTSKARKKSHPVENQELKDTSPSLSQNEQLPPESYFKKKMRQFFQWIDCKRKIKDQESPQQKAKFMSTSVQHQDSVESAAVFVNYGPPEAQELMTAIGKILEEKLAHRFESETSELSQHKKELQTQGEPDQAHPFNCGDLSDSQQEEWASTKSSNQEDVSADQSCLTSVRQNRDRIRHHQKVVAFEDQVLCQTQPSSLSSREPVLHPSPTCMHEECQVPSATLTPDKGTVFRDLSLLFKPKLLLQHFQGEKISP